MSSGDVLARIAEKAAEIRRGEAELLMLAAEADRDGETVAFGTLSKLLADVGRYGLAEARRLAERVCALHERTGLSGTPIPATMPNTAAAYADGSIGAEHVDKIRGLAEELPADVLLGEAWPIAEHALAEYAREIGPRGLGRPIREMAARLDPDGQEPDERELAAPKRELRITRRRNRCELAGFIDTETGLKLESLLDALGTPRSQAANGGQPDWRTSAERHGDALAEIIQLATSSGELPDSGGEPFTILLTAPETSLEPGHGACATGSRRDGKARRDGGGFGRSGEGCDRANGSSPRDRRSTSGGATSSTGAISNFGKHIGAAAAMDGTRIPTAQLQRIACDATVITGDGKHQRAAPPALRRALIARDQGCAHSDCDRPPILCHAHHIQHHAHDGPKTLDNMVLLCAHHHGLIHHAGWQVRLHNGRPQFTPPHYRVRISRRITPAAA